MEMLRTTFFSCVSPYTLNFSFVCFLMAEYKQHWNDTHEKSNRKKKLDTMNTYKIECIHFLSTKTAMSFEVALKIVLNKISNFSMCNTELTWLTSNNNYSMKSTQWCLKSLSMNSECFIASDHEFIYIYISMYNALFMLIIRRLWFVNIFSSIVIIYIVILNAENYTPKKKPEFNVIF